MASVPMRIPLDGLLTIPDIAAALKVSVEHVRDRIVHEPDFPPPVINRRRMRRWSRQSVEQWLSRQAALANRGR